MKKIAAITLLCTLYKTASATDTLRITSPDKHIEIKIWNASHLTYEVLYDNAITVKPSEADMMVNNKNIYSEKFIAHHTRQVNDQIVSPVPEKRKVIPDVYNELTLANKQSCSVTFRAYNDGVAYRFETKFKDSITVNNETAVFNFNANTAAYFPEVQKRSDADIFHTSFEEPYPLRKLDSVAATSMAYNPLLVIPATGVKLAITESDLEDYAGMFLQGSSANSLTGMFANYPLEEKVVGEGFQQSIVTKRADYIVKTKGTRSFPWRIIMLAKEDKELPSNDLVYRLGAPSRIADASWVHPGKATEEWIIGLNFLNVPFKSGVNTASYKYYIDFAKRFGFERILMDAGWSDNNDLFKITPGISIDTITAYAKQQGIKVSMWTEALTLNRQLDSALDQFNKWGVDFIMTDFIDRDDAKTINFYHRVAKACAAHKIMIMYHGAYPPKGFNRTYPNAVTREGVLGSEYNVWSNKATPEHDVTLPFTRMLAGSLDYEPGILDNATREQFRPISEKVMSQGTRCHQLAMFVVYDSPMQFFSGNPSQGLMEPKFMELLGSIPTTWDDTKILEAKVADYIITARKKNNDWYVGGMTDWTPRTFTIPLDFLDDGNYELTICRDGINANRNAMDYAIEQKVVSKSDKLTINMAAGGGFMMRLKKQ